MNEKNDPRDRPPLDLVFNSDSELLTPRQKEAMQHIIAGRSIENAAAMMGITEDGVESTLRGAYIRILPDDQHDSSMKQTKAIATLIRNGDLKLVPRDFEDKP